MKKPIWNYQFYISHYFNLIPSFNKNKLLWKDKFNSPRCELIPQFKFEWLWFGFYGSQGTDEYWEQWLWVYKYHQGDIEKARKEWGWVDYYTKKSTWDESHVKNPIDYIDKADRFQIDGDGDATDDFGSSLGGQPLEPEEKRFKNNN